MAWSNSTQQQFMPMQRREGCYVTFGSTSETVNIYCWMTKIDTIQITTRASGNGLYDEPLTASATITNGYFVVTRPSSVGGGTSIWYEIVGE